MTAGSALKDDTPCGGREADQTFTVELRRTGAVLEIPPGKGLLEAVLEILPGTPHGCREGYCGACATIIVEGEADHRDGFLTAEEQASNEIMMICVGRSRTQRLVLDL